MNRFTDYASVRDWLHGLKRRGVRVGLERMQRLVAALGHPERAYPLIHVAGTNGKGSTSAMLEAILRRRGLRVGLYTSPHLVHQGERIQVDRLPLSEDLICTYTAEIAGRIEGDPAFAGDEHPSFFEFMTAMAFLHFARAPVDAAVIEVGLGGRLDATNVITPVAAAITSIGFDHCEILGHTFAAIAFEKAGILKPGVPAVMGRLPGEAAEVVRRIAAERGCPLDEVEATFGPDLASYPRTNLEGDYQRWNAATACLTARRVARQLGLTEAGISAALLEVEWAGRWQRVRLGDGSLLILDTSHNPEGAAVLESNLSRLAAEGPGRRPAVVCGVLGAFRAEAILPVVARHAGSIHLVIPQQERASSFEVLEAALPAEARSRAERAAIEELFPRPGTCRLARPDRPVVVTGSIYLIGEVLQRLRQGGLSGQERLQDW